MRMALPLRFFRWSARFGLGALFAGTVLMNVGGAGAEPPARMDTYVVDSSGELGQPELQRVRSAVDELYTEHQVRLWVYYVRDFDGMTPQQWAASTAARSGFGNRDLLLAVATQDRAYAMDGELPQGVSEAELDSVLTGYVEPQLRANRWAEAGVAAADGIGAAVTGGGISVVAVLVIGGVIVLVVAGLLVFSRKRQRKRGAAELKRARGIDPTDSRALAGFSLDTLDTLSREMLVDIDNAVHTSGEELELAAGEFGDIAVTPFRRALARAKAATARAFAIRQQLDDDVPETPPEQRAMLLDLISTVGRAEHELDDQVAAFDAMRDLLINAGDRLDALTRGLVEVTGRVPAAEAELARLNATHTAHTLASISDNITMARERVAFAEQNIDTGREALRRPVGEQGAAVPAIRSAEAAVGQANALLDAVLNAAANIEQARAGLPAALAELRTDLAAADELSAHGGPELASAAATARAVLASATESTPDPLAVFHDAVAADAELDRALEKAANRKLAAEDLRRRLDQALLDAGARVRAATDFISTRRGGIDAAARTRLSEAQRHLDEAQRRRDSAPEQALPYARAAADLAGRALQEAQSSVRQWETMQGPSGFGSTGAVLGGILIGEMLRGAGRGGFGGGFGGGVGGGFGPASFGGSAGSRRVSRGGRF